MTRGFDYAAFASFVFPALGVIIALGGTALIVRKALRTIRDLRNDAKHWRDEDFELWQGMDAEKTVRFPKPRNLGSPLTVHDQIVGFQARKGHQAARHYQARHRLAEPVPEQFRGTLSGFENTRPEA